VVLTATCGALVECAYGWRLVAIAATWALVWPAGRQFPAPGCKHAVSRLTCDGQGRWALYDTQGLHYVQLLTPPLRLGPLFWFTFRNQTRRWHLCLDAKVMEPVELRALQLRVRELPVIRDR
jgi:hypothetical protein